MKLPLMIWQRQVVSQIVDGVAIAVRIGQAEKVVPVGNQVVGKSARVMAPGYRQLCIPTVRHSVPQPDTHDIALAIEEQRLAFRILHREMIGDATRNVPAETFLKLRATLRRQRA